MTTVANYRSIFTNNNIDEGKRWDIRNQMLDFLQILNKENYFSKIKCKRNRKTSFKFKNKLQRKFQTKRL